MEDGSLSQDEIDLLLLGIETIDYGLPEKFLTVAEAMSKITDARDLKSEILDLSNLDSNKIPKQVFELHHLKILHLSHIGINNLPEQIRRLHRLEKLYIDNNEINEFPKVLFELKNLELIDIQNNNIVTLPPKVINMNMPIFWDYLFPVEKGILLANNPIQTPPLEIVKQGAEAIENYFLKQDMVRLFEAKMLIVGEGGVGKTCVLKRILNPFIPINMQEASTEGIAINKLVIKTKFSKNFNINLWDFGGQEIYHATHQFFLTKRSLYLLVYDARKDDDLITFDYWLNVIKLLSDNSPVIIVLNKIDERLKTIDEEVLRNKFPNIIEFHKVSAKSGIGINGLLQSIINRISKLDHVGTFLPKAWVVIKNFFEKVQKTHNFITYNKYIHLCRKVGLDEEQAFFIGRYLHDLGFILHFHDSPILKDIIFLKPEWATNAVYKIVDTKAVIENKGTFTYNMLIWIWQNYPNERYIQLLELMKRFEICFQIPGTEYYIVPELLPSHKPTFQWNYENNLRFEFHYDFMPSGIITRLIVRTHDLNERQIFWKNGAVLIYDNAAAMIVSEKINKKIKIWIDGIDKKGLLSIIRREIGIIHKSLNNPNVKEMVPCVCTECKDSKNPFFHDYSKLKHFLYKKKRTAECNISAQDVSIGKLLGEFELTLNPADLKIAYEVKDFMIKHFSNEHAFDNLCRQLRIQCSQFAGNFTIRITSLIQYLERRFKFPAAALKECLLVLSPNFQEDIKELFSKISHRF